MMENKAGKVGGSAGRRGGGSFKQRSGRGPLRRHWYTQEEVKE